MFLHTRAPTHTKSPSLIFDWISCIGSNITKINAHPWVFLAKKSHFDGGAKLIWGNNNISCYTLAEWIMKWLCADLDRHSTSYITMACCYFEYRMLPGLELQIRRLVAVADIHDISLDGCSFCKALESRAVKFFVCQWVRSHTTCWNGKHD